MATSVTFAYGSYYGPLTESPKTQLKDFDYGWFLGPIVGLETAAGGGELIPDFLRARQARAGRRFDPHAIW